MNREQRKKYNKKWREEHKEHNKGYTKKYYKNNKNKINKRANKYHQKNKNNPEYKRKRKEYREKQRIETKKLIQDITDLILDLIKIPIVSKQLKISLHKKAKTKQNGTR